MSQQEPRKKKKKKQQQVMEQDVETENVQVMNEALEELEKQKKVLDIQVCPNCKSSRVRRAKAMTGDMSGHMGLLPPKFECPDCGWQERTVLKVTNRKDIVNDVVLIAESLDFEKDKKKR